jgi:hypothetical protein
MKVEKGCAQNDKNEFGCTPAVEENAEGENDQVFEFFVSKVICQQKCRQKIQKKYYAAEDHLVCKVIDFLANVRYWRYTLQSLRSLQSLQG